MRRNMRLGVVVGLVWLASGVPLSAAEEPTASGSTLYLRNCAPCHGEEARGDGPNASLLLNKPRNLREGFLDEYPTDVLVRRIVDGRPLSLGVDVEKLRAQAGQAEAIDRHIRRLPTLDWLSVERGWGIYAQRCSACHGTYGRPPDELPEGVRSPRDLGSADFQKSYDDAALIEAVRHGRKGMPALVPRLSVGEARDVAALVRVFGPGFESYSKACAPCHGDDGVGIGNFDQTVAAPALVFNAEYLGSVDPAQLRGSIWHMLDERAPTMPHFRGQITDAEAGAVVEYLRKLPSDPAQ